MSTPNDPILELRVAPTTGDYERLVKFYCEGLGIEPAAIWNNDGGKALILNMGKATLELFDEAQAEAIDKIEAGSRVSGQIRFALQVPDLKAAMERLLSHRATLVHHFRLLSLVNRINNFNGFGWLSKSTRRRLSF